MLIFLLVFEQLYCSNSTDVGLALLYIFFCHVRVVKVKVFSFGTLHLLLQLRDPGAEVPCVLGVLPSLCHDELLLCFSQLLHEVISRSRGHQCHFPQRMQCFPEFFMYLASWPHMVHFRSSVVPYDLSKCLSKKCITRHRPSRQHDLELLSEYRQGRSRPSSIAQNSAFDGISRSSGAALLAG